MLSFFNVVKPCFVSHSARDSARTEDRQNRYILLKYLRKEGLPAVPYHIQAWQPFPGLDLIAVVALGGGLTVFQIVVSESVATSAHYRLVRVFHDSKAFPRAVLGASTDARGELVVLSATGGSERRWVICRASWEMSSMQGKAHGGG